MIVFVDTSALASAYLGDEADGAWIANTIFDGPDPVVVSELTDLEIARTLVGARQSGRININEMTDRLDAYSDDTATDGPIGVLPVTSDTIQRSKQFVLRGKLRSLDALHLAAAQLLAEASKEEVVILTRDDKQSMREVEAGPSLLSCQPVAE